MTTTHRMEQEILGEMLLSNAAIDVAASEGLLADHFHHPAHRMIFDRVLDLHRRGQPADPVTVTMELHRSGDLFTIGGAAYLHTLISMVPDPL